MDTYHQYPPFGEFGVPSTHYAPVHSHSTSNPSPNASSDGRTDAHTQVVGKHPEIYYSNSVPAHPHSSDNSYAAPPPTFPSTSMPAQTHNSHLLTEATPVYAPADYHEASYPTGMYASQEFGMNMGLGVEPSFAMGVAGSYNVENFGGFGTSMNAGLGGGAGAGSYHTYGGFQNSVDDRAAYATHAHFVQQPANYAQPTSTSTMHNDAAAPVATTQLHEAHMGYAQQQALLPQPAQEQFAHAHAYSQVPYSQPASTQQQQQQHLPPSEPLPAPPASTHRALPSNTPAVGSDRSSGADRASALSVTPPSSSEFTALEANAPRHDRHRADHSHVDPHAPPSANNQFAGGITRNPPRRQTVQVTPSAQRKPDREGKLRRSKTTGVSQPVVQLPPPFAGQPTFPTSLRATADKDNRHSIDQTPSNSTAGAPNWQQQQQHAPPAALYPMDANWARSAQLHQAKLQQERQQAPPSSTSDQSQPPAHTRSSSFSSSSSLTGALGASAPQITYRPGPAPVQQSTEPQWSSPSYSVPTQDSVISDGTPYSSEGFVAFRHQNEAGAGSSYYPYGVPGASDKGYQHAMYAYPPSQSAPPPVEQQNFQQNDTYDQHDMYQQQSDASQHYQSDPSLPIQRQGGAQPRNLPTSYELNQTVSANAIPPTSAPELQSGNDDRYQHVSQHGEVANAPQANAQDVSQDAEAAPPPLSASHETFRTVSRAAPGAASDSAIRSSSNSPPLNRATLDLVEQSHSLHREDQRYELVASYTMRHGHAPPPEWRLGEAGAPSAIERAEILLTETRAHEETGFGAPVAKAGQEANAHRNVSRSPPQIFSTFEIDEQERLLDRHEGEQSVDRNDNPELYRLQDMAPTPSSNRRPSIADPSPVEPHEAITPISPMRVQPDDAQFPPSIPVTQQENGIEETPETASLSHTQPLNQAVEINSHLPMHLLRHDGHISSYVSGLPGEAYDGRSYLVDDPQSECPAPPGARLGDMPDVPKPHPLKKMEEDYHVVMSADKPIVPPQLAGQVPSAKPRLRLTTEKKAPPKLACLFCRARKIACGPSDDGLDSRTCNQCERRRQVCVFPTESKRGTRSGKRGKRKKRPGKGMESYDEEVIEVDGEEVEGESDEEGEYTEVSEPGPSTPRKRRRKSNGVEKSRKRTRGKGKGKGRARDELEDDSEEIAPEADEVLYLPSSSQLNAIPDPPPADMAPPPSSAIPGVVSMDDIFIFDQREMHMQAQSQGGLPLEYFESLDPCPPVPIRAPPPAPMRAPPLAPLPPPAAVATPVEPHRPSPVKRPRIASPPKSAVSEESGPFATYPLQVTRGRKGKKSKR